MNVNKISLNKKLKDMMEKNALSKKWKVDTSLLLLKISLLVAVAPAYILLTLTK